MTNNEGDAHDVAHDDDPTQGQDYQDDEPSTAYEKIILALEDHGSDVIEQAGNSVLAQCPAHPDNNPSLVLTAIDGKSLVHCRAGCETPKVMDKLGLGLADLFDPPKHGKFTGILYDYLDEHGEVNRTVRRYYKDGQKRFWQDIKQEGRVILFNLAEVIRAVEAGETIYLVEGEEDVRTMASLGLVATTAPMGAGNFSKCELDALKGATVKAIVDRDNSGKTWRNQVRERLGSIAGKLEFLQSAAGKDVSDHIAAGHSIDELQPYEPPAAGELFIDGATFLLSVGLDEPALWGAGDVCLWAPGESLMFVGPPGVGKSTMTHLVVFTRLGLLPDAVGWPVVPGGSKILYLALDRPKQIARAMKRLARTDHWPILRERLVVRNGPLPVDICDEREWLRDQALEIGADTIVVDSLKDVVPNPSDEDRAGRYNQARQIALAAGVEWIELHHNRKGGVGNKEPNTLDDVYGSRWLTAGAGSVVSLFGEAGDVVVSMKQLKTPSGEFFPRKILLDKDTGLIRPFEELTIEILLGRVGRSGASARRLAEQLFNTKKPDQNQIVKTRSKLKRMVKAGLVEEFESLVDGGQMFRNGGDTSGAEGQYVTETPQNTPRETSETSEHFPLSEGETSGETSETPGDTCRGSLIDPEISHAHERKGTNSGKPCTFNGERHSHGEREFRADQLHSMTGGPLPDVSYDFTVLTYEPDPERETEFERFRDQLKESA
jgi:AAA domain